jgi:site-specific DNA-methyltransferase (adenine-specific)
LYRYSWIWKKDTATGHLNANYKPMRITEDIAIFSKGTVGSASKNPITYYPQGVTIVNKIKKNNPKSTWRKNKGYKSMNNILNSDKEFVQKYSGYPNNILEFPRDKNAVHPTQKPVALLEYLIKTYTNEDDLVLDNCMGSGSTGVACLNTNRNFIGMELNENYFNIAKERIENAEKDKVINA